MAISLKTAGTWVRDVTDPTAAITIPGSPAAGDRMFLFATWKTYTITTASISGWTPIGTEYADGTTAAGNGTGSMKVMAWYRDWQSGDTGPSIDWSAAPTEAHVVIQLWQKGSGETWATPTTVTGAMTNWTTTSQTFSASSSTTIPDNSVVMGLVAIRDDTATMTRPTTGISNSAGSVTWNGNYVESPATHISTTTGNDAASDLGHRFVTTGGSATLSMTGTISAAETGAGKWVIQGLVPAFTQAEAAFYEDGTETGSTVISAGADSITEDVTAGDQNLQLRVRLQETGGASGASTDDYQLQYELNDSGVYYGIGHPIPSSSDDYSFDNFSAGSGTSLGRVAANSRIGQSITGVGETITSAYFGLTRVGSPTGNLTATIYAHSGSFGTSSVGTGTALATSDVIDASTLTLDTSNTTAVKFTFSGGNQITLTNTTNYILAIEKTGSSDTDYIGVSSDSTGTHSGNACRYDGAWSADFGADVDIMFYINATAPPILNYNSASLTDGNATTNRLGSGSGSFVAGEISEDGLVDNLQITASNYTELLYSLTIDSDAVADNDTLDFRVLRNGATTGMTYTVTPRITIEKTVGNALISTLTDNFADNSIDTAKWDSYSPGSATIAETGAQLVVTLANATAGTNYAGVISDNFYDLTAGSCIVEVPTVGSTSTNAQTYLKLAIDSSNYLEIYQEAGTIYARRVVSGTPTTTASATYNASTHRWWRIREASGTTYWDYSSDGTSWSSFGSVANPIAVTGLKVELGAGTYQSETSPGTAVFDNFNLPPTVLAPNDSSWTFIADNGTITQNHILSPNDSSWTFIADTTTIAETHVISSNDSFWSFVADSTTITQNHVLTTNDASFNFIADAAQFTQEHVIQTADAFWTFVADATTITQNHILSPNDSQFTFISDTTTITQDHVITSSDSQFTFIADATTITQNHVIAPQDAQFTFIADNTTVEENSSNLAPNDSFWGFVADATTITQNHVIAPADSQFTFIADGAQFSQEHVLQTADSHWTFSADTTTISQIHSITSQDSSWTFSADGTTISQNHVIATNEASWTFIADNTTIDLSVLLETQDSSWTFVADTSTITQDHVLSPVDSAWVFVADSNAVSQNHVIATQDSFWEFIADGGTVTPEAAQIYPDAAVWGRSRSYYIDTDGNYYLVLSESAGLLERV